MIVTDVSIDNVISERYAQQTTFVSRFVYVNVYVERVNYAARSVSCVILNAELFRNASDDYGIDKSVRIYEFAIAVLFIRSASRILEDVRRNGEGRKSFGNVSVTFALSYEFAAFTLEYVVSVVAILFVSVSVGSVTAVGVFHRGVDKNSVFGYDTSVTDFARIRRKARGVNFTVPYARRARGGRAYAFAAGNSIIVRIIRGGKLCRVGHLERIVFGVSRAKLIERALKISESYSSHSG